MLGNLLTIGTPSWFMRVVTSRSLLLEVGTMRTSIYNMKTESMDGYLSHQCLYWLAKNVFKSWILLIRIYVYVPCPLTHSTSLKQTTLEYGTIHFYKWNYHFCIEIKHCNKKRNCSFLSSFSFCHNVFTSHMLQLRQKAFVCVEGLTPSLVTCTFFLTYSTIY